MLPVRPYKVLAISNTFPVEKPGGWVPNIPAWLKSCFASDKIDLKVSNFWVGFLAHYSDGKGGLPSFFSRLYRSQYPLK